MSNLIDLTHSLTHQIPTWDGCAAFDLSTVTDYKDCESPNLFRIQSVQCRAGIGTHIDSPSHVVPGGRTVDLLSLAELVVDCVVIDLSGEKDECFMMTPEVVEEFEGRHGRIPAKSMVIAYFGWDDRWNDPHRYHNQHRFPSIDPQAAKLLIDRKIAGLGTDTLSCDRGDQGYPSHHVILGNDRYLVENVANAGKLPPMGARVATLPMKLGGGTEAPVRLVAILDSN